MEAMDGIYLTFPSVVGVQFLVYPVSYRHFRYTQNGLS
jgi:hypothetical protein